MHRDRNLLCYRVVNPDFLIGVTCVQELHDDRSRDQYWHCMSGMHASDVYGGSGSDTPACSCFAHMICCPIVLGHPTRGVQRDRDLLLLASVTTVVASSVKAVSTFPRMGHDHKLSGLEIICSLHSMYAS